MTQTNIANSSVQSFDVLGVNISAINMTDACQALETLIDSRQKGYVIVCPVSTIIECFYHKPIREIVNGATLVTPDGMPSVWIGRARGFKNMDRVYGPDLMLAMCELSSKKGYKQYFYGATDEVLRKLEANLNKRFPNLQVCGKVAPPFRALTKEEDERIIEDINRAKPDCLWVGLGSPKQDLWIQSHRDRLNVPVMFAVGAAFDFIAGTKPQAPKWVQRSGLEWLFRFLCEPKRLWRRYLVGNTLFIYHLIRESLLKRYKS
jgi:N-acetylglucosaminyldiphosphoundecaprenol N-acetyl-beta-D-mannosaminyltransferase